MSWPSDLRALDYLALVFQISGVWVRVPVLAAPCKPLEGRCYINGSHNSKQSSANNGCFDTNLYKNPVLLFLFKTTECPKCCIEHATITERTRIMRNSMKWTGMPTGEPIQIVSDWYHLLRQLGFWLWAVSNILTFYAAKWFTNQWKYTESKFGNYAYCINVVWFARKHGRLYTVWHQQEGTVINARFHDFLP